MVTVNVTVATPDNPPNAVDNPFAVVEDDAEASFDILANDTRDVDDQPFVIDSLGTPSAGGAFDSAATDCCSSTNRLKTLAVPKRLLTRSVIPVADFRLAP